MFVFFAFKGGGVIKHHILNANLMRNGYSLAAAAATFGFLNFFWFCLGADFSVFINTGQEFDGSDSGASPDEAVSWGKIKIDAESVKVEFALSRSIVVSSDFVLVQVSGDASLLFPLLVSQTFAKTARPIDDGKKKSAHSV